MNFISMFSGIEAASVAFRPFGWRSICFAEVEAFPSAVLVHHYPDTPNVGDMTAHDWSQYRGRCDLVVGGPPCQAFSVAGLRESLNDHRGNLSLSYMRAVHAIDPLWCVTENVPGWLSTKDNAFGCFLAGMVGEDAELVPPGGRWTDAGVVTGPERTAAWRILDAQYFGLAQRRRRVFVLSVRGSGNWACAAALFPFGESLSWNPPPRREKREGAATSTASGLANPLGAKRDGGWRGDLDNDTYAIQERAVSENPDAGPQGKGFQDSVAYTLEARHHVQSVAYGGNNTRGPIDIATAVNAHGGPHGRQDFESETFIAHTLKGEGFDASEDGTGRGVPLVPTARAIAFSSKDNGRVAAEELSPTLRAMGHSGSHANAGGQLAVAFNPQAGGKQTSLGYSPGADTTGTLECNQIPAVAFGENVRGELRTMDIAGADSTGGGKPGQGYPAAMQGSAVRRLTPRECERLQGFQDDYTLIPLPLKGGQTRQRWSADGPRYKALGNSMAVPVMRWIGERIELVERLAAEADAA